MAKATSTARTVNIPDLLDGLYGPGNGSANAVWRDSTYIDSATHTGPINRKIMSDDFVYVFEDGSELTGKEFRTIMNTMKKLAMQEYPEDFV